MTIIQIQLLFRVSIYDEKVKKPHLVSIDFIRLLSFLAILAVHVSKVVFEFKGQVDTTSWWWAMFFNTISRFGTPMFIMVSGYLLLGSESVKSSKEFYVKRASKILLPIIFWNIFYYWLYSRFNIIPVGWKDFLTRFLSGGTYYHLYFLELIGGLYVITPLLSKLVNKVNLNIVVPALLSISFGYLVAQSYGKFPELNNLFLWFIPYIGYYLAGYWIGNKKVRLSNWWYLVVGGLLMVGVVGRGNFLANRLSFNVEIASLILFWLVIKIERLPSALTVIGKYGMGLYLLHPLVIEIFRNVDFFADMTFTNPILWMMCAYFGSLCLTVFAVIAIKKSQILSRLI